MTAGDPTLFPAAGPNPAPAQAGVPAATAPGPVPAASQGAPGPSSPAASVELPPIADPAQVRAAADYLRAGRARSLPSEALLFAALAGTIPAPDALHGRTAPNCRSELYGCLRLTHDLPWTSRGLEPLAAAFPGWRALRGHWDEMAATLAAEVGPTWPELDRSVTGFWPDTPRTVELLRRVLAQGGISI